MADGYAHTSSDNCVNNGLFNWNLDEILEYRVRKCFTYDTRRVRWTDSFELLKIFTKSAIEQPGTWSSPGGKYKKFTSSNSDLTFTWNYESGTLTFHGKVGKHLKDLLIYACAMKESILSDRSAETGSDVCIVKDNRLTSDFVNLPGAVVADKQSMYAGSNFERETNTEVEMIELFNVPWDNSISVSRPNNKHPDINECPNVCDCSCKQLLEDMKLDLEILRSQVDSLQCLANSQEACPSVINDFVRLQIELCDERIRNLGTDLCLLTNDSTSAINKLTNKIDRLEAKFENVLNKTIMENSREDNVSHTSFVSENNVGHDKQKPCVHEKNEINYQGNQRNILSPTLTIYDNETSNRNNIIESTMISQQCITLETTASSIETPKEKTNLDIPPPNRPPPQSFEWLARLPLTDDDNSTAFKNNIINKTLNTTHCSEAAESTCESNAIISLTNDLFKKTSEFVILDSPARPRSVSKTSEWIGKLPLIETPKSISQPPFLKRPQNRRPPRYRSRRPRYRSRRRTEGWLEWLDVVRRVTVTRPPTH